MMILPSSPGGRFTLMEPMRAKNMRYWLGWMGVAACMAIVPLFPRSLCYALGRTYGVFVSMSKAGASPWQISKRLGADFTPHERQRYRGNRIKLLPTR